MLKGEIFEDVRKCWVLKTIIEDKDRSFQTIDSYNDKLEEYYNYDSLVPNSKQISSDDFVILIDKEKILGFATIGHINISPSTKTIRRCPKCQGTTIDTRKTKRPKYRCNKGHEFEVPIEEVRNVDKYTAFFSSFTANNNKDHTLKLLRSFYMNGYNQNMSMQRLNPAVIDLFIHIKAKLLNSYPTLEKEEGYIKDTDEPYINNNKDERDSVLRAIKLRRGQQDFRNKLLKRYNNTCIVTGCKIIDILEAAHINPYRGINDNHPENGLLLRADIHTLFDLNLITINPYTLTLIISDTLLDTEYKTFKNQKIIIGKKAPSEDALLFRWNLFNKK